MKPSVYYYPYPSSTIQLQTWEYDADWNVVWIYGKLTAAMIEAFHRFSPSTGIIQYPPE